MYHDISSQENKPRGKTQLRRLLEVLPGCLARIDESRAGSKAAPETWSAKQELGHLIDSAANNHQRIVRAQLENSVALPEYDGDRWVELHNYQNREWRELIGLWTAGNCQLLNAAETVSDSSWANTLTIGGSEPVTLEFVIDDYIDHMMNHLRHIGVEVEDLLERTSETPYPEKPAQTDYPINQLLRRRWSPRAFDDGKEISKEMMMTLLEAARWAPSCFNDQPRYFLVFEGSDVEALEKARRCLTSGNAWASKAPVLVLSVSRETFEQNGKPNRWGQHDTGLATENLLLEAVDLGLAAHPMAGYDAELARSEFGIPDGFTPIAMIAIGHPYSGNLKALDEKLHAKELAPRTRKPVSEFAFGGYWGHQY